MNNVYYQVIIINIYYKPLQMQNFLMRYTEGTVLLKYLKI